MTHFMARAIDLAVRNVETASGGPFGALIVCDGQIISEATNTVTGNNDPTAHAEVNAIRTACARLRTFHLTGCDLYTSCEPCPMCLGAIYWARLGRIFYAGTRADAMKAGFDDDVFYRELKKDPAHRSIPMIPLQHERAAEPFNLWLKSGTRQPY